MSAQPALLLALVIEDEPMIRCNVVDGLLARGWDVVAVATGEEALAATKPSAVCRSASLEASFRGSTASIFPPTARGRIWHALGALRGLP